MSKRRNTKERPDASTDVSAEASDEAAPSRRWTLLATGAVCAALVVAFAIAFLPSSDPERVRLKETIADLASESSPKAASLLDEAGAVADRLLKQFPNTGRALDVAAQLYHGLGKTKDAVRCWERCIKLDPELAPSSHAAIGAIAYEEGNLDVAAEHYRIAMQLDPTSSTYPVHLGEALIDGGKPEEAVGVLEDHLKASPTSMPAHVLLGQALFQLRQYEQARKHLEMGVQMGPEFTNAYYSLTRACAALGDQEKSKEYLEKFKKRQAQEAQLHRDTLKATGETDEIRRVVAQTYAAAAQVYILHGDCQAGEAHLIKAAEISPNDVESGVALAWLYEQQGRTDEAIRTLAEVSQTASDNLGAQLSIASAYTRLKHLDEAESAYRRAIELTPHRAGGYAALANFYIQAGRKLPEARTLARKAIELEPTAGYYFLLSLCCQRSGDLAGATAAANQAIALDPDNKDYQRLRLQLRDPTQSDAPRPARNDTSPQGKRGT